VVVGLSGAECGIRGFIDAYYAETGEQAWRFYTVPSKDEPVCDTWEGDYWMTGGGSAWVTGSYNPELNLVYWGTGNPAPAAQQMHDLLAYLLTLKCRSNTFLIDTRWRRVSVFLLR